MKIRLTLTVVVLLFAAMLLVNLVLITIWKRDIIQRENKHDQACLQQKDISIDFERIPCIEESSQAAVLFEGKFQPEQTSPLLAAALRETAASGQPVSHAMFSFSELTGFRQPQLASAAPIIRQGRVVGAAGIVRSLDPALQTLWQAQRIVFTYILFNLLALTALFFFRLNSLIVRPVERLVELAGRHSGSEAVWFAAEDSGSEFNRLANSLNSMLARIEHDRQILRTTVAELEAANRQIHERQEELIRAEKLAAAGRLAAGLAHEIGNPLAVIQGYLGLLERSGQSAENQDFIRRAAQELERVTRLVRQLLDCARSSKGKPEDVSLHELMEAAADMVRVQKAFRQIKLTVQAEAAQDQDRVHADPDQLRQVLLNCLLNSADAVDSAGRTDGAITLTTDLPEPGMLRLRIGDNGIGIAAEQLGAVFDPFFTTKEPGRGTGLGLSVSRSIVEAAGGSIKMESRAGQGSTVSIYLPLAQGGGGNG